MLIGTFIYRIIQVIAMEKKEEQKNTLVPLGNQRQEPIVLDSLSAKFMKQSKFFPMEIREDTLRIVMADPDDFYTINAMELACGLNIEVTRGNENDILEAIENTYGAGAQSVEKIIEEMDKNMPEYITESEEDIDHLRDLASEAPVIKLVNRIITKAVELKASDIHFEPFEKDFKIRYRIDGLLHDAEFPPKRLQAAIISRVKIMAKMNIAERRLPQDGRIKLKISDKEIDFRISTIPTLFGESLVIRILDRESLVLDFIKLGFPEKILAQFSKLLLQPYGIILVTGPTGSGKTTTLYTALSKLNSSDKKIITVEDPVEYQLKGINQIQINPRIGLTFATGLRSIVRQDPDIILIGEIRDKETAEIATQSALTGHLVFSTLHTNDAVGAITRMVEMGVENYLLTSSLIGVLAQRLVRKICPHCKKIYNPEKSLLKEMEMNEAKFTGIKFFAGSGCEKCRFTGYIGRTAIIEYLAIDEDIKRAIMIKSNSDKIKQLALKKGMVTLRESGWEKIKTGVTTISEVLKTTLEEQPNPMSNSDNSS